MKRVRNRQKEDQKTEIIQEFEPKPEAREPKSRRLTLRMEVQRSSLSTFKDPPLW
jgi:hypothetical protein